MRATLLFLLLLCPLFIQAQDSSVAHMDRLAADFDQINKDTWDYIKKASRGKNANKIEKRRNELAATLKKAKYNVGRVPSYKGDQSLKEAYANYLNLSYLVINDDYKRIVDMERIAEESYDAMEAYLLTKERVNDKMDAAFKTLQDAQQAFAEKYNINLTEGDQSRISRKLENAGEVTHYYNKVYLLFYKGNWYEAEMIKAQSAQKVGDIEQFRQTLEVISKECKTELAKIKSFRGDNSLKVACSKMLNFYHEEAKTYMPKQIDFYAKSEKMETMSKNMEAKKRRDLTQEDIDQYNQAIEEYNKEINNFNKINDQLNKQRKEKLDDFNDALSDFYKKFL